MGSACAKLGDRAERSARSDRRRSSDWMKKPIDDVGHYIGREGIAHQKKRGRVPWKFFT
jgi:hypothetical protein